MFNPMGMINMAIQKNPQLGNCWAMTQQMTNGKSPEQVQQIINNIARQKGIDLQQAQQMFQSFMNGNGMSF